MELHAIQFKQASMSLGGSSGSVPANAQVLNKPINSGTNIREVVWSAAGRSPQLSDSPETAFGEMRAHTILAETSLPTSRLRASVKICDR